MSEEPREPDGGIIPVEAGVSPGALPRPRVPGTAVVRATGDEVIDALAADMEMQARACVRAFGDFHLALSGGTTPEPLYARLMVDPVHREFPWARTHLWVVDERCVPEDDARSNFGMIREMIVDHSGIPPEQVHPIRAMEPGADSAYEAELKSVLGWRERGHDRLDFVLLGMGDDGHTASLFPGSRALDDGGRMVLANDGEGVRPPARITMTLHLLNASRCLALLVLGEKKRGAMERVVRRAGGMRELPVLGLRPLAGELRWYLDRAACPG